MTEEQKALYDEIATLIHMALDAGMDGAVTWLRRQREREFASVLHRAEI